MNDCWDYSDVAEKEFKAYFTEKPESAALLATVMQECADDPEFMMNMCTQGYACPKCDVLSVEVYVQEHGMAIYRLKIYRDNGTPIDVRPLYAPDYTNRTLVVLSLMDRGENYDSEKVKSTVITEYRSRGLPRP